MKKLPEVTELVMWQMQTQLCSQPDALMPPYSNTGEEEKRAPKQHGATKVVIHKHLCFYEAEGHMTFLVK